MSFVVVTLVYILVFLCGEGLSSEQIRNDPTRDYDAIKRYWLRVCSVQKAHKATTADTKCRCNSRSTFVGQPPSQPYSSPSSGSMFDYTKECSWHEVAAMPPWVSSEFGISGR
jgi:hypothetical protein